MSRLALFFTRGVALSTWRDIGSMERECQMYQYLARRTGTEVVLVTYGGREDRALARNLDGLRVVSNRWGLPMRYYLRKLRLPGQGLGGVSVVKTNQFNGSAEALQVARGLDAAFVCRCGYFPSTKVGWQLGLESDEAREARAKERRIFSKADIVSITTEAMRDYVIESSGKDPAQVFVVPNFVDVKRFAPPPAAGPRPPGDRLIYVGRFESEKNVLSLVEAVSELDLELWLVGSGSQTARLQELASSARARIRLLGNVANEELPALLHQATAFVLPSYFEHHPKALLEAMACGLPCIGSDVFGIRGLIGHEKTGLLAGPEPEALRQAIVTLLGDEGLQVRLGAAAREDVVERFRFEAVARREIAMLQAAGLRLSEAAVT